jgi:hypothetical protein
MGASLVVCAGTAFVAGGLILLEFGLTRVYAFLFPGSGVFALLALASSGLVTGGLVAHRLGWDQARRASLAAVGAALAGLLFAGAIAAALALVIVNSALVDGLVAYLAYGCAGVALAAAYTQVPGRAGAVFAAQLAGGGLAAACAPPLLDAVGPVNAGLGGAAAVAAGGLCHAAIAAWRAARAQAGAATSEGEDEEGRLGRVGGVLVSVVGGVLALATIALLPLNAGTGLIRVAPGDVASPKPLFASVQDSQAPERVSYTEWDSVGRVDVADPVNNPDAKWLYLDGDVVGLMHRTGSPAAAAMAGDIGFLPFALPGTRDKVLIIGGGGGQEIAMALAAGATEVVVAEPAPGVSRAAQQVPGFSGSLYSNAAVRTVVDDGRTFLRSTDEQFDVIYLTLSSGAVTQPGGVTSGSYLYTLEAFDDYLNHLRQDGRIAIRLRDEHEFLRAFNTAFQSLTRRGSTPLEAIRRLLAVNNQLVAQQQGGGIALPLLTIRKTPYIESEARAIFETLQGSPYPPLFVPFLEESSPLGGLAGAFVVEEAGPPVVEAQAPYRISPATDSSPFFFYAGKGIPWALVIAAVFVAAVTGGLLFLARRPAADVVDTASATAAEAAAFLDDEVPWRFVGFVLLVGAGTALVQLPYPHQVFLLVGRPELAAAIVPAALLIGGALGAALSQRVSVGVLRPFIGWAALGAGLYAVALMELMPMAAQAAAGEDLTARAATAAALLAPLGVALGVPFPCAVRLLAGAQRGSWAALLWALAAAAAAASSLLALAAGMAWSFAVPTAMGALCLLAAFLMAGLRFLVVDEPAAVREPVLADTSQFRPPAVS